MVQQLDQRWLAEIEARGKNMRHSLQGNKHSSVRTISCREQDGRKTCALQCHASRGFALLYLTQ